MIGGVELMEMKGAAMSELEKAKQEVEQVCFAYDKAGDTGDIKDWKEYYDLENKLLEKVKKANQPQLTIPKSIAEMLDFIYDNHFDSNDDISWVIANIDFLPTDEDYYNFDGWINLSVDNHNLALAYLAGKALGVDLVKVVEG